LILLKYVGVEKKVLLSATEPFSTDAFEKSIGFKKLAVNQEDAYGSLKKAANVNQLISTLLPVQFIHLQGTSGHDREVLAEFRRQR
jgi:hypothetical protein